MIAAACAKHGVGHLYVFGSALREDFRPRGSDIDLLVEFPPMEPFALVDAYFGLLDDLRSLIGTDVDLVMASALKNRYVAAQVNRDRQLLYAA
jgi:predicted nucleotidyltransferase